MNLILMNEEMKNGFTSPVYGVRGVPVEKIRANSYNPNVTAPPEMHFWNSLSGRTDTRCLVYAITLSRRMCMNL